MLRAAAVTVCLVTLVGCGGSPKAPAAPLTLAQACARTAEAKDDFIANSEFETRALERAYAAKVKRLATGRMTPEAAEYLAEVGAAMEKVIKHADFYAGMAALSDLKTARSVCPN